MLTSALGASIAVSMATAYGCAGTSSGMISTGVWQLRTKPRVTVKTKSGLVRYILVRYFSTISIVISGRRLTNSGPVFKLTHYRNLRHLLFAQSSQFKWIH